MVLYFEDFKVSSCHFLQALMLLSKISPDLVGNPIEEERLYDAVDCILYSMVYPRNCI
jgi:achilleol B synthase